MNYIAQINAFERWLESHPLGMNAQMLWYKLMYSCSRAGWPDELQVDNLRLMALLRIESKNTFFRCRDELAAAGRILVTKGKKGAPNRYKIIPFPAPNDENGIKNELNMAPEMGLKVEPKAGLKMEPKTELETGPIYKNKNKNKKEREKDKEREIACAEIVGALNTAAGTSYRDTAKKTRELINARLNEGYTLEDFRTVIAKKTAEWKDDPRMAGYLRPETLFGTKFEQYLGQRPAGGRQNGFHNFDQRNTDYDAILREEERRIEHGGDQGDNRSHHGTGGTA